LHFQRALDRDIEPLRADRLDDEIDSAGPHCANGAIDRAVGGLDDDRGHAGCLGCDLIEHAHAVNAGHHEIEQDEGISAARRLTGFQLLASPELRPCPPHIRDA
jgi:hypothetical protein